MKKTKYESYSSGKFPKGCKECVKGRKMVLFVTGLCTRGCYYCPLSKKRKNIDIIYANEREIKNFNEIIEEIKISNAKGCSLTGGDPLLKFERTLDLASKLKKEFKKNFHIHIYLSTKLVTEEKLKELSLYVDEVRFHPDLEKPFKEEIEKIALAKKFWKNKNIGIELPCFPDKLNEIKDFLKLVEPHISFVNLNELESGEFSEKIMSKKYLLSKEGYTIKKSIETGKKIILDLEKEFPKLNIHLCTAKLKNWHQYRNRLKNYKIPKWAKRTKEGTFIYFVTIRNKELELNLKKKDYYIDNLKNRLVINPRKVINLKNKFPIYKIEEYPTYEREEAETELLE